MDGSERADDADVAAALDAAAAVGPYFAVSVGPVPADGWTPLQASLAAFVDETGERLGTSERRVAASIMFQGLAARLASPVVAGLERGMVLDLDPALTAVRSRPGEALGVRCSAPRGWLTTSPSVVASVLVERQLRPLVTAFSADVAAPLLWGNVASVLVGAVTVLGGEGVASSVVRSLLASPPLVGALDGVGRRRSCCLYYRVVPGAFCGDCALVRSS